MARYSRERTSRDHKIRECDAKAQQECSFVVAEHMQDIASHSQQADHIVSQGLKQASRNCTLRHNRCIASHEALRLELVNPCGNMAYGQTPNNKMPHWAKSDLQSTSEADNRKSIFQKTSADNLSGRKIISSNSVQKTVKIKKQSVKIAHCLSLPRSVLSSLKPRSCAMENLPGPPKAIRRKALT